MLLNDFVIKALQNKLLPEVKIENIMETQWGNYTFLTYCYFDVVYKGTIIHPVYIETLPDKIKLESAEDHIRYVMRRFDEVMASCDREEIKEYAKDSLQDRYSMSEIRSDSSMDFWSSIMQNLDEHIYNIMATVPKGEEPIKIYNKIRSEFLKTYSDLIID